MKIRNKLFSCLCRISVLTTILISAPVRGDNAAATLHNGSFEFQATNNGLPDGWSLSAGKLQNPDCVRVVSDKIHHGKYAVKVLDENATKSSAIESLPIQVKPGSTIEASGWFFVERGEARLYLQFYDGGGKRIDSASKFALCTATSEWGRKTVKGIVPDNSTTVKICLYSTLGNAGSFYADEITFSEKDDVKKSTALPSTIVPATSKKSSLTVLQPGVQLGEAPDFKKIPSYSPEALSNSTLEQKHSVLNVFSFGAVADGKSHRLKEDFSDQDAIDKRYGTNRYVLSDEKDFVAACEAIRYAKHYGEHISEINAAKYTSTVYFPRGVYVINRTINIADSYGFTLRGDGRLQTIFRFMQPMPLFYVTRSAYGAFREFCIESTIASKSTGIYIVSGGPDDAGKPAFLNEFDSIGFSTLYRGVQFAGLAMTDSGYFFNCRFLNCMVGVHWQNGQSLEYAFYGCNFQSHGLGEEAVVFLVEAGGMINVFGGSIILKGTTLKLMPNMKAFSKSVGGGSVINPSNGNYNFYGVRWEQMSKQPVLFDAEDDGRYNARINVDSCAIYQRLAAKESPVGMLRPGLNVTLRNTSCSPHLYGKIIGDASAAGNEKRRSVLVLDNTSGLEYEEMNGNTIERDSQLWKNIIDYRIPGKQNK